jgi:DnaJ-class molecular chaperone
MLFLYFCVFQALCGTTLHIPSLDHVDGTVQLNVPGVIKPTTVRRIDGRGLPFPKQPTRRGDLIVEFNIKFPDQLSAETKRKLSQCLP